MADIKVKVSDLTRAQRDPGEFGRLVVKRHPAITAPVELDVLPEEVKDLQARDDLVQLDYYGPGSDTPKTIVVTQQEFDQLATDTDMAKVLAGARGVRGRRAST